jgi:hypothetical protein
VRDAEERGGDEMGGVVDEVFSWWVVIGSRFVGDGKAQLRVLTGHDHRFGCAGWDSR